MIQHLPQKANVISTNFVFNYLVQTEALYMPQHGQFLICLAYIFLFITWYNSISPAPFLLHIYLFTSILALWISSMYTFDNKHILILWFNIPRWSDILPGDYNSPWGVSYLSRGFINPLEGFKYLSSGIIIELEGFRYLGVFRYLSKGFINPLEGFRFLSRGFKIPLEGYRYSSWGFKFHWSNSNILSGGLNFYKGIQTSKIWPNLIDIK